MKVAEGQSKEQRIKVRKNMGSLKSLTVQPTTKARYAKSLELFFSYLKEESLTLPKKRDHMDDLCSDYVEFLWSSGEGRASANNFMAAIQDFDPKLRHCLPGSWRLLRTWTTQEVPNRAPPLPEPVLRAMVGWSFFHEDFKFGLSLLLAFFGLLRTGELLGVQAFQIHMISGSQPAVVSLGFTKSGKRQGAAESITISELPVLQFLWIWKQKAKPLEFLTEKPHVWRAKFSTCLDSLKLTQWDFRPYSLRRGGATFYFVKTGSLDRVLLLGRWTAVKTAKIYINSGLALQAELQIPPKLLTPFHRVFSHSQVSPPKLEPASKGSRTGGRGKRLRKEKKRGKLLIFCLSPGVFEVQGMLGLASSWKTLEGYPFLRFGV